MPAFAAEVQGTLQWSRRVELGTPVTGIVAKVAAEPGARVSKGQLLVQLDDRRYRAELAKARADVERLARVRDEAKREQERAQELYDRNLLSNHEMEVEKIAYVSAESQYQSARAAQIQAELNVEYSTIKAPFDALVLEVRAEAGQAVVSDLAAVPLVIVVEAKRMLVKAPVEESAVAALTPGRELAIQVGGQRFTGTVRRVGFEQMSGYSGAARYPLEVVISAEGNLRAGQSVTVVLP
jgi:multidrug efflux system membrane fusion protein